MKFISEIDFKNADYDTTIIIELEAILKLGGSGRVEYTVVKINGVEHHCFKRPKRFQANY